MRLRYCGTFCFQITTLPIRLVCPEIVHETPSFNNNDFAKKPAFSGKARLL